MPINVAVLYRRYAHEKATRLLAGTLARDGRAVVSRHCLSMLDEPGGAGRLAHALQDADVAILSCGGRDINAVLRCFPPGARRPYVVSLFPGIVLRRQLDAFVTRLGCDRVLLNSPADMARYRMLCAVLRVPCNGELYGAAWFEGGSCPDDGAALPMMAQAARGGPASVFFEQAGVPHRPEDMADLARKLLDLARRNPERHFYIKIRASEPAWPGARTTPQRSISDFMGKSAMPPNVSITDAPVSTLLGLADSCLTVSSSAAIEALLRGRHVYIVADYPARQNHLAFFRKSGLLTHVAHVDFASPPVVRGAWMGRHVVDPQSHVQRVSAAIVRAQAKPRPPPARWRRWLLPLFFPDTVLPNPRTWLRQLRRAFQLLEAAGE